MTKLRSQPLGLKMIIALVMSLVGFAGAVLGTGTAALAADVVLPLSNNSAPVNNSACPNLTTAYWHFVIAGSGDHGTITSVTVNLPGGAVTYGVGEFLYNTNKTDQAFVPVPAGNVPTDLIQAGTTATTSGGSGDIKLVWSHICEGTPPTTTTTTTTTTTMPETTTTEQPTTTTEDTTVSTPASSDAPNTTSGALSEAPTTVATALVDAPVATALVDAPTIAPPDFAATQLPSTGSRSSTEAWLALLLVATGSAIVGLTRRARRS